MGTEGLGWWQDFGWHDDRAHGAPLPKDWRGQFTALGDQLLQDDWFRDELDAIQREARNVSEE